MSITEQTKMLVPPATVPDWNAIDQVMVTGRAQLSQSNIVNIATSNGTLSISVHEFGIRLRMGSVTQANYEMLQASIKAKPCTVEGDDHFTTIVCEDSLVHIHHSPFSFSFTKADKCILQSANDGHFVRQYRLPPLARVQQGWLVNFQLGPQTPVYGLGEKWSKIDKRGQYIRSNNHDALGVNAEISYKNTPFAWSNDGWGVFVHTPSAVSHSVGFAPWSQRAYGLLVEDESLDLFILHGSNGQEILKTYHMLTGSAPVPPAWSLGVILSKAYYKNAEELLETARMVRHKKMPCDVITLDGRAWQDTDTRFAFEWDAKRYPNPATVLNQLKAMHFKICIWEYPLVSVKNPLFDEMAAKGWLLKDKRTGQAYRYSWDMSAFAEVLTPLPESGIVDFTHPEAYAFWLEAHKPLFDLGIDMIKADFGEQVEDNNMLAFNGDSGLRLHNVYSLLYNRCVYEAAQKYSKNGPFLFSRSAWTGSHRYPSQWGGDPQADWGGLAGSIRGALSWGMSGAPYYATDVGGFYKDTRDAELYVRWAQTAVFCAHMRLHGIGQREPWSYGADAEQAVNQALRLRYQLLPYIQGVMQQAHNTALPAMRAMPLAFPKDKLAWPFDLQFMLGDHMLVAPCIETGGHVEVYIPMGDWVRFPCKTKVMGGKLVTLSLALNEMAVFVRKGNKLPLGPDIEHTDLLNLDSPYANLPVVEYWLAEPVDE
jgi:alpha-D-xyloside xylohydrolase